MNFKKYPKVHRLGKEETDGILDGHCTIQEKIDGANTSVWLGEDGQLCCGTRTRHVTEGFNGFVDYVNAHEGMKAFFKEYPESRLNGEWLVKHTIAYDETKMKKFYLFDVTISNDDAVSCPDCGGSGGTPENDSVDCKRCEGEGAYDAPEKYLPHFSVRAIGEKFGMEMPQIFMECESPDIADIQKFVGTSNIGENGEGVVIKNYEHKDKWGNHCHAKIVTEGFLEDNGVAFGGNNKHSDTYWEMYIMNKYMTLPRIKKQMSKLQPEIDRRLSEIEIPRIASMAYHDMLTEEIWEISKKVETVDFKALKRVAIKKAIQIYKDILNDTVNVNDQEN